MITEEELSGFKDTVFSYSDITYKPREQGWEMTRRYIAEHTLIYIVDGKGKLCCDARTYVVEQGKIFLLAPGQIVGGKVESTEPVRFYMIPFSYHSLKNDSTTSRDLPFLNEGDVSIRDTSQILTLLKQMYEKKDSQDPLQQWHQRILFQEVIYTIVSDIKRKRENGDTNLVIERVLRYIHEHYMKEISVKGIAEMFGLSPTNFSRIFTNYVGVKPTNYITQLRIQKSKELLYTNQRLKVVAQSVGYQDELYFSRIFKKTVGISPTIYVKRTNKRIVTINPNLNDYFITLGVQPVATYYYEGISQVNGHLPYLAEKMAGTKIIGRVDQPNYDALLRSAPDLILNGERPTHQLKSLEKIAPTIVSGVDDDWKSLLLEFSRLIDRKEQALLWLNEFEAKASKARNTLSKLVEDQETVMVLIVTKKGIRIYGGRRQLGVILYKELGLTPPPGIQLHSHFEYTNLEHLKALNPDHIFLSTWAADSCEEEIKLLKASYIWNCLKAVETNQVYEIDHWLNLHAPLKNMITIDRIIECLGER